MPANRSRTEKWRLSLEQIAARGGSLEIAVARLYEERDRYPDLMWRVRVLHVNDHEIVVEQPMAMGRPIELARGVALVAVMAIGQNRWKFDTKNLGNANCRVQGRRLQALRLASPDSVERCLRRDYERMDTAELRMPLVSVWPLLDPASVLVAEQANELGLGATRCAGNTSGGKLALDTMPDVGPEFKARLMNIGGGGVGLMIDPADASSIAACKHYWLRLSLPGLDSPICVTAKMVHSHMESSQHTYAGLAFDFAFNPANEQFVVQQICEYIAGQQRMQFEQPEVALRKSA